MLIAACLLCLDFRADMKAAGAAYKPVSRNSEQALIQADFAAAQKQFLDVVAEADRTAAHWLVLGNVWFGLDPAFSTAMHRRAFALAPEEPDVAREWVLELLRAGQWTEAEPILARLVERGGEEAPIAHALRAECLLRLGRPAEAALQWTKARESGEDEHLLHAFEWIHAPESGLAKRARLVAELRAGRLEGAEELVFTDLFWRREGPKYFVKYEYLEHDLKLAVSKLGADSERAQDLSAIADFLFVHWEQRFPEGADSTPRKQLERAARERGWIGADARVPRHSLVARHVVEALSGRILPAADLLESYEPELLKRCRAAPPDAEAARALVWLCEAAGSSRLETHRALVPPTAVERARAAVATARTERKPLAEALAARVVAELADEERDLDRIDAAFAELGEAAHK